MNRSFRRLASIGALSCLLGIAACSSLLGIEDVHQGPAPGSEAGTSGNAAGGESNPNGGASNAGTSAGGAAHAGTSNGGASGAGVAGGGDSAGTGADAGAGGAPAADGGTVTGHVIDYWGHKISKVPVAIGTRQVLTDDNGGFTFDAVPHEYDVSLTIQYEFFVTQTHAYVYQGLTRRDPTLQVYRGSADLSGNLDTTFTGTAQSVTGTRSLTFAMGGPDGSYDRKEPPKGGSFGQGINWVGPATTIETAHGLVWQNNDTTGVPEGYFAYASAPVALFSTTTDHSMLTLDLSPKTIASGTLAGTVTPAGFAARSNSVSLRFTSGAAIRLALVDPSLNNFSYLVPTLSNSSVTFAASEGCLTAATTGCAIVHKDGLASGTTQVSATIPAPVKSLTATPAGAVDANTQFTFATSAGSNAPYVSIMQNRQSSNDRLLIIGSKRPFKIPTVVNGAYVLLHGEAYGWQVETHGTPASVDEMAGPSGFIDAFSGKPADLQPRGSRPGDGTYTLSAEKALTIAN